MEEITHITEMGLHAHPSYSWEGGQNARTEGAIEVCAEDSLVEAQYCAGLQPELRKPVMGEEALLENTDEARRRAS